MNTRTESWLEIGIGTCVSPEEFLLGETYCQDEPGSLGESADFLSRLICWKGERKEFDLFFVALNHLFG